MRSYQSPAIVTDHRLKRRRGLTPYEFIGSAWAETPERFTANPRHQVPGPNS
jgi:hypothetical protein